MSSTSDPWRWKLRLFASVDLVGATAYKASKSPEGSPAWVATFTGFFEEFPGAIQSQYSNLPQHPTHCTTTEERLRPWKFLGDEILFTVVLNRYEDATTHVLALKKAIHSYSKGWSEKGLALRLKGTAWLAGFPVTNREVQIAGPSEVSILDFIGPQMDLGFRIAKFADDKRLVVSADLALLLLDGADRYQWEKEFYLVFRGREVLKGVIGNDGYPIVFLHMEDGVPDAEEKLLGIQHLCNRTDLKYFVRNFIDNRKTHLFFPFIDGDPDPKYNAIPPEFIKLRDDLRATDTLRGYVSQAHSTKPETNAPETTPQAPLIPPDTEPAPPP